MSGLTIAASPEALRRDLLDELAHRRVIGSELLITDNPHSAKRSEVPTVLLPTTLSSVVGVMCPRSVEGVLHPRDIKAPQHESIVDGCLVYPTLTHSGLTLTPIAWEVVRRRAHGQTVRTIGNTLGYSKRQVIRICDEIRADAGIGERFAWDTLAPLFPCPEAQ